MAYDTITLTGKYQQADTTAARGHVNIALVGTTQLVDEAGQVIVSGSVSVTLDETGAFSVSLPDPNDATLIPFGFGYSVAALLGGRRLETVVFEVPPGTTEIDMAEVTPATLDYFDPTVPYATDAALATETAARAAADTALDVRLDAAEATLPTKADSTALDDVAADLVTEAAARVAADAALDARLTTLEDAIPGTELGFAELTADFTTTNTTNTSITDGPGAGGVIPSFSIGPIVGTGRPVKVEFHAPQVRHTTASAFVNAYLIVNGVAQGTSGQNSLSDSPATNIGRELTMHRRLVLTNGVSYTFKIGIQGGVAGTTTLDADATATRAEFSVIAR